MSATWSFAVEELASDLDDYARRLADLSARASAFAGRWRGRLGALTAAQFAAMLVELDELSGDLAAAATYPQLLSWMGDDSAPDAEARASRPLAEIRDSLRLFTLEWGALDDETASRLLAAPELERDAYALGLLRRRAAHALSEEAERAVAARQSSAETAWQELWHTTHSGIRVSFDGPDGVRDYTLPELGGFRASNDRDLRHRASALYYDSVLPHAKTLATCYDTLVADRLAVDRLRGLGHPMEWTNLENELSNATVDNLLERVAANYGIGRDWYRTKAALLGSDRLPIADMAAPLGAGRTWTWDEALAGVRESFEVFPAEIRDLVDALVADRHIDVFPRPGKASGALCQGLSRRVKPYVLVNFTGSWHDPSILAHELGHAMHDWLFHNAQSQLSSYSDRGAIPRENACVAEIASTFAEHVYFESRYAAEKDENVRRELLAGLVDMSCNTVFVQVAFARYEQAAYELRASGSPLTAEQLADLFRAEFDLYFGDAVERPESHAYLWGHVPHFVYYRFNTYGYVFAKLVALALFARFRADREAFMADYVEFLRAGGSRSPRDLLAPFGFELERPDCWDESLAALAALRDELGT